MNLFSSHLLSWASCLAAPWVTNSQVFSPFSSSNCICAIWGSCAKLSSLLQQV